MQGITHFVQKHVVGIAESATASSALKLMRGARVSLLPVIADGVLVGILTREIATDNADQERKVKEIMLKRDLFVEENASLDTAANIMIKNKISRVPVVNNKRQRLFVGIVTASDIVKQMKN